ncbi:MAG: radical SAM peptide maturase [Bacteroides sp.]|nr:radical SAM peptide maturase [Bacteroides sp.]
MRAYISTHHIEHAIANMKQLVFEVTDSCNLRCKYCTYGEFYEDYDKREDKNLSIEKATKLIDYLSGYWDSELRTSAQQHIFISFYGGEPLLNMPFIKAIVRYITEEKRASYRTYSFSLTTNAVLLNRYMDYFEKHKFRLLVSLDGDEKNTSYRVNLAGHNAFSTIMNNVDVLRNKYPQYFEECVSFNAVLHNKNSVQEIYSFFKNKFGKIPRIGELNSTGIREDKKKEFMETYRNTAESLKQAEHYEEIERDIFMQADSYRELTLYLYQYSGYVYNDYTDLLIDKSKLRSLPTGTCMPFSKKMFVTVNGKILPCERIGHQFALGEITDHGIVLNFSTIVEQYNTYFEKMEKQCENCWNVKSCRQCLFNLQNLEKRPICNGYMNENAFNQYTKRQIAFLQKNPEMYKKIMEEVNVI